MALYKSNKYKGLYEDKSNKYKGLYEVEQMEEILKIMKIHGTGPKGNFDH